MKGEVGLVLRKGRSKFGLLLECGNKDLKAEVVEVILLVMMLKVVKMEKYQQEE